MTPSRATIIAATPKCPKNDCAYRPMVYDSERRVWVCACGAMLSTDWLIQKQAA